MKKRPSLPARQKVRSESPTPPLPAGLSQPALRALATVGIRRLEDFVRFTADELLALHGLGPRAILVLQSELQARGLSFRKR